MGSFKTVKTLLSKHFYLNTLNQIRKCSSNIMNLSYEINILVCPAVRVPEFCLTPKWLRTWSLVATRDQGHKHFRFAWISPELSDSCRRKRRAHTALQHYVNTSFLYRLSNILNKIEDEINKTFKISTTFCNYS